MVSVRILFFAAARSRVKKETSDETVRQHWRNASVLLDFLCTDLYPALEDIRPSLALAINEEYVIDDTPIDLQDNDRVALIPPITGG